MYISAYEGATVRAGQTWPVRIVSDDGAELNIDVINPKLKVFKQFQELGENSTVEDISGVLSAILSKNKQKIEVSADYLLDNLDSSDLAQILADFGQWLNEIHNTKN